MLAKSSDKNSSWLSYFVAPIVSALIAGIAAYVGVQKEIATVNTTVARVSFAVDKMAEKQSDFFEHKFFPLVIKVEQHGAALNQLTHQVDMIKDDIKTLHPRVYDGRPKR